MESGVAVPKAYILSRSAGPGLVQTALAAFSITPLSCVIISDMKDQLMAMEFGELIVKTSNEKEAVDFAIESFTETQKPSLVIGSRSGISAIHDDGRVEEMNWQVLDSTIN